MAALSHYKLTISTLFAANVAAAQPAAAAANKMTLLGDQPFRSVFKPFFRVLSFAFHSVLFVARSNIKQFEANFLWQHRRNFRNNLLKTHFAFFAPLRFNLLSLSLTTQDIVIRAILLSATAATANILRGNSPRHSAANSANSRHPNALTTTCLELALRSLRLGGLNAFASTQHSGLFSIWVAVQSFLAYSVLAF